MTKEDKIIIVALFAATTLFLGSMYAYISSTDNQPMKMNDPTEVIIYDSPAEE